MKKSLLFFFLFGTFFIPKIVAHGDLHERIVLVTKEIKVTPDSSYLYLKRAKLRYQHESYNKSISDLKKSKLLGYNSVEQKLLFAMDYFKLNDYQSTLLYTENILSQNAQNVHAIKIEAETNLKLENYCESAVSFEKIIEYATQSFPENYIDASTAWELLNTEEGFNQAISIIQKGIEKEGSLITLYNRLIDLAISHNDYNFAILKQLEVIKFSPRKETAYYKLNELYLIINERDKALESLKLAELHYNKLPSRTKNTSFMKDLIKKIISKKNELKS